MPKSVERCVARVSKTVKPRKKGQSKEDAAWAICQASHNRMKKSGRNH